MTLESGPSDPSSNISLNTAFNGSDQTELLDQSISNTLAIGDSFTVLFTVEVDPDGTTGTLSNQVVGNGDAIDDDGNQIFDSNGEVIVAHDVSDSGANVNDTNAGEADDNGMSDDPTLFTPEARVLASIAGAVYNDTNGNGVRDADEAGIAGVEITLTGVDVNGNDVFLTTFTDANGDYVFDNLQAGTYQVTQKQPEGFNDGQDSSPVGTVGNDQFTDIQLGLGQSFNNNNFGESFAAVRDGTTSGSPARLPAPALIGFPRLSNQINSFLGGPGPIYSGIPINSNGNPLTLATNRPVTGGFSSQFAPAGPGIGDPAFAEACDPCADAAMAQPDQFVGQDAVVYDQEVAVPNEVIGDYGHAPEMVEEGIIEGSCDVCAEPVPCEACNSYGNCCDCNVQQKGVLFRIRNWLHR